MTNNRVIGKEITIDESKDYAIEYAECPCCHGLFGVDWTYLDQVDSTVSCPMCLNRIVFDGWE